jgi:pilus assembly protein Flp/PilA
VAGHCYVGDWRLLTINKETGIAGKGVLNMMSILKNLHKEESGQDLIEYALIGLLIALAAITAMGTVGQSINKEFSKISSSLT